MQESVRRSPLQTSPRSLGGESQRPSHVFAANVIGLIRSTYERSDGQNPTRFSLSADNGARRGKARVRAPGEAPLDQRGDDGCSLWFDSRSLGRGWKSWALQW